MNTKKNTIESIILSQKLLSQKKLSKPKLSVLMPAYKNSKTIGLSIIFALASLPKSAELLIWLDGPSTTSKILDLASRSKRVRVLSSPERKGLSTTLNLLLSEARGRYVARLDADDLALPFRYGKAIKLLESDKADLVFSNSILFRMKWGFPILVPQFPFALTASESSLALLTSNPFVHSTLVARKETLIEAGEYREAVAEDYDFWLRLAAAGKLIIKLHRFTLLYRVHASQMTSQTGFDQSISTCPRIKESGSLLRSALRQTLDIPSSPLDVSKFVKKSLMETNSMFRFQELYLSRAKNFLLSIIRPV
jgi:glycosyltransferase involved in cell wall biosynthesis